MNLRKEGGDSGRKINEFRSLEENVVVCWLFVDALPYIDLGYDEPGVREAVREREKDKEGKNSKVWSRNFYGKLRTEEVLFNKMWKKSSFAI